MSRDVAEYDGIKYSLQPHGLKSKLIAAFVFFVVAFGGALLAATPAQADPGDVHCFVDVTASPMPSPEPSPVPTSPSPTTCPTTPPPVTITTTVTQNMNAPGPTVTVTKTVTKTVYITQAGDPQTVTITETQAVPSSIPRPSETPPPPAQDMSLAGDDGNHLVGWGVGTVGVLGAVLLAVGVTGIARRRRYVGAHAVDDSETTVMEPVRDDDYSIRDYDPSAGDYDPALGGSAGESYGDYPHEPTSETAVIPRVDDTRVMPPVE